MSTVIDNIEKAQLRKGLPQFAPGDRVRVHFQVIEGSRRRTQVFEGVVLKRQGSGLRETFTVRKQSFGVGVERTFPLHSPKIEQLEVAARGDVRRAKLYYLRDRIGKAARVTERRWGPGDDLNGNGAAADVAVADEPQDAVVDQASEETTKEAETADAPAAPEAAAEPAEAATDGEAEEAEQPADASTEPVADGDSEADGAGDENDESKA